MREVLKVGISGVRGVIGDSFSPQVACTFAQAFGTFVGRGDVLVGRDTRPSGALIEKAVVAGLQSVGCRPVLTGVTPTPSLLVLVHGTGARGGIMITASHNPAPWNALKFIDGKGQFLGPARAEELFDIYHQQNFPLVAETEIPPVLQRAYPVDLHFDRIARYVDVAAIRARRFKVALDPVNGVGALYAALFLETVLGCQVVQIHDTPSGEFERDPEPSPAHLGRLSSVVREHGCAVGFAQDPDGDRLAVVDETGTPHIEDTTLALCVAHVLDHHAKGPVVLSLSTSRAVEQIATARGVPVIRTRIGEIHVTSAMVQNGSPVGGESNGGVIVPAIHPCRDSFAAMAIILESLAKTPGSLSQQCAAIPRYAICREKIALAPGAAGPLLRQLRRVYADRPISRQDGVHIDFGDAWIHVRPSNTEPVLRVMAEARTEAEARRMVDDARVLLQQADSSVPRD